MTEIRRARLKLEGLLRNEQVSNKTDLRPGGSSIGIRTSMLIIGSLEVLALKFLYKQSRYKRLLYREIVFELSVVPRKGLPKKIVKHHTHTRRIHTHMHTYTDTHSHSTRTCTHAHSHSTSHAYRTHLKVTVPEDGAVVYATDTAAVFDSSTTAVFCERQSLDNRVVSVDCHQRIYRTSSQFEDAIVAGRTVSATLDGDTVRTEDVDTGGVISRKSDRRAWTDDVRSCTVRVGLEILVQDCFV